MRRVLFIGQKQFGEEAWKILNANAGSTYRIVAACSNTSADAVWWRSNGVYAARGATPFIDNAERNEDLLLEAIGRHRADTLLCVQHPWVLSQRILEAVKYNAINFHNAKLPDYRGYNSINHAILNRDPTYTCTAHWMVDQVDRGHIALEAQFPLSGTETALSLYARCHHAGLQLFEAAVAHLGNWNAMPRWPMAEGGTFYGRRSIEALRRIPDGAAPAEVELRARAFFFPPFSPAFMEYDGRKLYILPEQLTVAGFDATGLESLKHAIDMAASAAPPR